MQQKRNTDARGGSSSPFIGKQYQCHVNLFSYDAFNAAIIRKTMTFIQLWGVNCVGLADETCKVTKFPGRKYVSPSTSHMVGI